VAHNLNAAEPTQRRREKHVTGGRPAARGYPNRDSGIGLSKYGPFHKVDEFDNPSRSSGGNIMSTPHVIQMRESRVLRKLRAGQVASLFGIQLADARVVEIASLFGFDCFWLDMEHVSNDWRAIEEQIWVAKIRDADAMVRVTRGGYSDYTRPLELDASGIMVPHIMNLEDARNVVRMTRFHPVGRRPADASNADAAFGNVAPLDYFRQANERRFLAIQIEDPEPLKDLDAITALDGIDIVFFGPFDFSQGIGAPAVMDHPLITETRKRVADVCRAHGKFAGTTGTPATIDTLIDMGYRFISIGGDVAALNEYCQNMAGVFQARQG